MFASVARDETIRLVIALACSRGWSSLHLDVKSAFLNGPLEEEVHVVQPPGFEVKSKEQIIYKFHKALYGLKQTPRAWNEKIDAFFSDLGFKKCTVEYGIYVKVSLNSEMILVCLYVDDILLTGDCDNEIE